MTEPNVRIVSEGGTGHGTVVTSIKDGVEFPGLTGIRIGPIVPGQPITAELDVFLVDLDISAVGRFCVVDPVTLQRKRIAKVVYADGTEFVPPVAVEGE